VVSYDDPRAVEFLAELPKNASGKLLRRVLRVR
jgi:acyl-coenzyme A synthetase/AMP-(fatty) acid ligase